MTKALISARSSFIFIYRDVGLQEALNRSMKEAEMAIIQIEEALYENLLNEGVIKLIDETKENGKRH